MAQGEISIISSQRLEMIDITDKLAQIKADLKIAAKIRDKHGITVICNNGVIITTYNNIQN